MRYVVVMCNSIIVMYTCTHVYMNYESYTLCKTRINIQSKKMTSIEL